MAPARGSSSSSQLVALFIVFLVARQTVGDAETTQDRINRICYQIEDYGFCNKTFNENLSGPADFLVLTQVANDQALRNATNTLEFIEQIFPTVHDQPLRIALQTCANGFSIVKEAMIEGISCFKISDYEGMLDAERIAPRAQNSCGVIFDTPPVKENPLMERNREMRILIAMALVTGRQLVTI